MAFETYLTVDKQRPRKGRRMTFVISLAVHAALLVVGVVSSYAGVDELTAKTAWTPIVFTPPPAPSSGPSKASKSATRPHPSRSHALRQPSPEIRAPQPDTKDQPDTGAGHQEGPPGNGKGNGPECDGCTGTEETQTHFLPPNVAKGQLAIDPQAEQYRVKLPAALSRSGMSVSVLLKICVDRDGGITDVKVLKASDALIEPNVVSAVQTWRYTPYRVDGRPVPFCTTVHYQIHSS
jgi:TonB family protein